MRSIEGQSKFIEVNGMRMHYIDEGSGPTILMVHGNPTWSYFYRKPIAHFSQNYRVVVPDHIGMGLSDKPLQANYGLQFHIDNLTALIEALNLKDIILVVHDWGGPIGFGYAVEHMSNVTKIVVMNTAAFADQNIPRRLALFRGKLGKLLMQDLNLFIWGTNIMCSHKPLPKAVKAMYRAPYDSPAKRIAVFSFVQDIPMQEGDRSWSVLKTIESKLPLLDAELLILWGKGDFVFTEHFYDRWRCLFPQAKAVLYQDAAHYLLEDKPDEIINEIEEFIA